MHADLSRAELSRARKMTPLDPSGKDLIVPIKLPGSNLAYKGSELIFNDFKTPRNIHEEHFSPSNVLLYSNLMQF